MVKTKRRIIISVCSMRFYLMYAFTGSENENKMNTFEVHNLNKNVLKSILRIIIHIILCTLSSSSQLI